jgi:hypothetical protein
VDKAGLVSPLEPDAEGSSTNKGPGFFYQPFALAPGMGTDGFLGDDTAALTEDDVAYVCKVCRSSGHQIVQRHAYRALICFSCPPPERERERESCITLTQRFSQQVEDDQKEIKNACFQYLIGFFKSMDEDGKGVIVGDAFKTAIGKLEEEVNTPVHGMPLIAASNMYKLVFFADAYGGKGCSLDDP